MAGSLRGGVAKRALGLRTAHLLDGHQDAFGCRGGIERRVGFAAEGDGIRQGHEGGNAQVEGRFAYGFGFADGVLNVRVRPEGDVEDWRAVGDGGDLVGAGGVGGEGAFGVPDQFLGCDPAGALNVGAFYLANVECCVERASGVMQDVGAQDAVFAGKGVDDDFGSVRALRVSWTFGGGLRLRRVR